MFDFFFPIACNSSFLIPRSSPLCIGLDTKPRYCGVEFIIIASSERASKGRDDQKHDLLLTNVSESCFIFLQLRSLQKDAKYPHIFNEEKSEVVSSSEEVSLEIKVGRGRTKNMEGVCFWNLVCYLPTKQIFILSLINYLLFILWRELGWHNDSSNFDFSELSLNLI